MPDEMAVVTQAASLLEWAALYTPHEQLREGACRDAMGPSITTALQTLLQHAFPALCDETQAGMDVEASDGWDVVVQVLEQFYEMPLGINKAQLRPPHTHTEVLAATNPVLIRLLEFALGAVVQCEEKAIFVRDIMTMSDAVQVDLMAVIEKVMVFQNSSNQVDSAAVETEEERASGAGNANSDAAAKSTTSQSQSDTAASCAPQQPSSSPHSPLYVSRNAQLERAKRENEFLKDENIHVSRELQDTKVKLQQQEADNYTLVETVQQLKLQLEVDVLRRERSIRAMYDERVDILERDLEVANADLHAQTAIASEVTELRDEVDLLRPVAERVVKMEATVGKYKARIEELASVKEKLRRIEDANAELMEKNLALETQVLKTSLLQRKLKEAKDANTAVEFRASELEALLSRQESELVRMRSDWETSQASLREATALHVQLQKTVDEQLAAGKESDAFAPSAGALSGGVSEFNPELMQKMTRLEFENQDLRKQVNGETSERIDGLLDEIEDLSRLKKTFEARYFDTEERLQQKCEELNETKTTMSNSIRGLKSEVGELNSAIEALRREASVLKDRKAALQEDVNAHEMDRRVTHQEKLRLESSLQHCEARCADQSKTILSQKAEIAALQDSLKHSETQSEQLESQLIGRKQRIGEMEVLALKLQAQMQLLESDKASLLAASEELEVQILGLHSSATYMRTELVSRSNELTAARALFGATFEEKEELEDVLQKTSESSAVELECLTRRKDEELHQLWSEHRTKVSALESAHSDSLCRMTEAIDAKAIQIEELKSRLQDMGDAHISLKTGFLEEKAQSEKTIRSLQLEIEKYMDQHSMSNAEWDTKECELVSRISGLEKTLSNERSVFSEQTQDLSAQVQQLGGSLQAMHARSSEQETKLKATIKHQLDSNHQLIETNQVLKSELKRKTATVVQLENSVTRLESKVLLLEKERVHISNQEERKREADEEETTFSSQLNTQVGLVIVELEKLQKEHKELRERAKLCQCHNETDHANVDTTKKYYLDRIRQLEQVKHQEEDKRRELLLVNAKLIQEQKQFQAKNAVVQNELQQLREKMNSWLLRDERRRKQEEVMRQKLQALESKCHDLVAQRHPSVGDPPIVGAVPNTTAIDSEERLMLEDAGAREVNESSGTVDAPPSCCSIASKDDPANTQAKASREVKGDENLSPNVSVNNQKRKFEDNVTEEATEAAKEARSSVDCSSIPSSSKVLPTKPPSAPVRQANAKRRMSLYMTSQLQSNPTPASDEKPSECQQQ